MEKYKLDKKAKKAFQYIRTNYPQLLSKNNKLPSNITKKLINDTGFENKDQFNEYIYAFYKDDKKKRKLFKFPKTSNNLKTLFTPFYEDLKLTKQIEHYKTIGKTKQLPTKIQDIEKVKEDIKIKKTNIKSRDFKGRIREYIKQESVNKYVKNYIFTAPEMEFVFDNNDEIDFNATVELFVSKVSDFLKNPLFFGQVEILPQNKKISIKAISDVIISTAFSSVKSNILQDLYRKILKRLIDYYEAGPIKDIVIAVFTPKFNSSFVGGRSKDITFEISNKYFEYHIPSTNNCAYDSISLARNPELFIKDKDILKLKDRAKRLKADCNINNSVTKLYTTHEDLQIISNKIKTEIVVHKSNLEILSEIKPDSVYKDKRTKPREPIHLVLRNNHYVALLEKEKYPELLNMLNLIKEAKEKEKKEDVLIPKQKQFNVNYHYKYAAWDIEASLDSNKNFKAYAVGLAYYDGNNISYVSFWGLDCLHQFINYLYNKMNIFNSYTFYAHNGGKFDVMLFFRECMGVNKNFQIYKDSCVEQNGRFIKFEITDGKHKIRFLDSLCMFAGQSLKDITKAMKVKHQKLDEEVDHNLITLSNYSTFEKLSEYLRHDCMGLLECILSFSKTVFESKGINLNSCVTAASLSKKTYYKKYYDGGLYFLTRDKDKFIRNSYFGGRNEVFLHNKHIKGSLYYYDFTSLYPSVGTLPLPMGKPEYIIFNNNDDFNNFYGFCEVKVKSKKIESLPIHAFYKHNKLLFQHFKEPQKLYLYSEEIRLGMKHNIYDYDFSDCKGIYFPRKKDFLKKFFEDSFANKSEAKKEGNDVMELTEKIITNSGYGFWGLRYSDRECIKTTKDESQVQYYFEQERLIDFAQFGDHYSIKVVDDLPMTDFNVAIASAITSNARMELWNAINDIKNKGFSVYYCDTDSIITDCKLSDHYDLMERYCKDGKGEELGTLKNECLDKIKKYNKKYPDNKIDIEKQTEIDNGELRFDELKINGCKYYGIRKTCYNGAVIDIVKCKGYRSKDKELTFDQFISGEIINQKQLQFSIPKSNLFNENKKYGVSKKEVEKVFKPTYSKGIVNKETGIVESFYT